MWSPRECGGSPADAACRRTRGVELPHRHTATASNGQVYVDKGRSPCIARSRIPLPVSRHTFAGAAAPAAISACSRPCLPNHASLPQANARAMVSSDIHQRAVSGGSNDSGIPIAGSSVLPHGASSTVKRVSKAHLPANGNGDGATWDTTSIPTFPGLSCPFIVRNGVWDKAETHYRKSSRHAAGNNAQLHRNKATYAGAAQLAPPGSLASTRRVIISPPNVTGAE